MNRPFPHRPMPQVNLSSPPTATTALHAYLQSVLDSTWELYLQPFLNGDYPSLAALHPIHGLTIFVVFDWDLRRYRCEQRGRYLRYFYRTADDLQPIHSPIRQVEHYIENLINLYLPYIGESIARDRRTLSAFQVGLYFSQATTYAAQTFAPLAPGRGTVFGYDALEQGDLARILPATQRPGIRAMPATWLKELQFWLAPPQHLPVTTDPLVLTEEQLRHVQPSSGRHQRLHGVAGSGKTLVIAQRAANLAAIGKRVLIVTFNVTLWQYIHRLVNQSSVTFEWQNIEFHHFHGFCKNVLVENGVEWPRLGGRNSKDVLDEIVPRLINGIWQVASSSDSLNAERARLTEKLSTRRYDAILIDEGQDFLRSYYDTLCRFLTANDEVLFVADRQQNLYLRDDSWLDKMRGTKFRGRWREMKQSYRLPPAVAAEVNRFAAQFFANRQAQIKELTDERTEAERCVNLTSEDANSNETSQIESVRHLADSQLYWHNIDRLDEIARRIHHTIQWLIQTQGVKPAEIVVLTPNQRDGWKIVATLEEQGMAINHILAADDGYVGRRQRRFRKRTFAPGDERLKVSTIHGFKGWELNTVILVTPANDQFWEAQSPYLFYVAMTRTRQTLIVFNRHPAYRTYGATWNELDYDPTTSASPRLQPNNQSYPEKH